MGLKATISSLSLRQNLLSKRCDILSLFLHAPYFKHPRNLAQPMPPFIKIENLSKVYQNGHVALNGVDLEIEEGELIALLGPNGAGKTTLISIICGLVRPSSGSVTVNGHDIIRDYQKTRKLIGLVPQELPIEPFESVIKTVKFSRGLFGKSPNPQYIDQLLSDLSLYDKKYSQIKALSGGMKRRLLIAKALSHEPRILFLDEPTAGVDVNLRKETWDLIHRLRESGVTIILTTHYIEEAEEMADRVAVINNGSIIVVERKTELMQKMGKKQMFLELQKPMTQIPEELGDYNLYTQEDGTILVYNYETTKKRTGITSLLKDLSSMQIGFRDLRTEQSSLEDIFMDLVDERVEILKHAESKYAPTAREQTDI